MSTRTQYNRMKSRITNTEDRQRLLRLCIEKLTESNKKIYSISAFTTRSGTSGINQIVQA